MARILISKFGNKQMVSFVFVLVSKTFEPLSEDVQRIWRYSIYYAINRDM